MSGCLEFRREIGELKQLLWEQLRKYIAGGGNNIGHITNAVMTLRSLSYIRLHADRSVGEDTNPSSLSQDQSPVV